MAGVLNTSLLYFLQVFIGAEENLELPTKPNFISDFIQMRQNVMTLTVVVNINAYVCVYEGIFVLYIFI